MPSRTTPTRTTSTSPGGPRRRSVTFETGAAAGDSARERLIDAAFDEFASRGYAAVTTADIAAAAGVNKQLISYHFGGKEGLYRAIQLRWLDAQDELRTDEPDLAELAVRYLRTILADPRTTRLKLLQTLDSSFPVATEPVPRLPDIVDRQRRGELAAELDPRCVLLALVGMVVAPVALASEAQALIGSDTEAYAEQLRLIIGRLAR